MKTRSARRRLIAATCAASCAVIALPTIASAAINWNGNGGNSWWFDASNWSGSSEGGLQLPPVSNGGITDTQINPGTTVEYDPVNDPFFADAGNYTFPTGYGPTTIWRLYVSNNQDNVTTLNLRSGDLSTSEANGSSAQTIVGRTGTGIVNQYGTNFTQTANNIDLGASMNAGANDGTWNYYGGKLSAGLGNASDGTTGGIRLGTGATAKGTLNIHNTGEEGYVRVKNLILASTGGAVATLGMYYGEDLDGNGGTRPIQVTRSLRMQNGNSSRLDFVLESNPEGAVIDGVYIPETVGLVDVAFGPAGSFAESNRIISGTFYDAAGVNQLIEGSILSAVGPDGYTYRWTLTYTGEITWADPEVSSVASITGAGTGRDVVLIGLDSTRPAVVATPGDYNGDGFVDSADYTVWADHFGQTGSGIPGDGNGDGVIDSADYTVWADHFGQGTPPSGAAAVPEPAALAPLAGCALLLNRRRR